MHTLDASLSSPDCSPSNSGTFVPNDSSAEHKPSSASSADTVTVLRAAPTGGKELPVNFRSLDAVVDDHQDGESANDAASPEQAGAGVSTSAAKQQQHVIEDGADAPPTGLRDSSQARTEAAADSKHHEDVSVLDTGQQPASS
jgi:hypothetical protein